MPKEVGGEKNQRLVTARPQGRWVRRREERRLSYSYGGRKETWYTRGHQRRWGGKSEDRQKV